MGAMPSASWGPGLAPQVCLRGTLEATCTLRSSPDWLLRATSSLLGCGGPLAPAHCLWATTSGPAPEEAGARVSRWGHTRTHSAAETGAAEKGGAGPDAASPSAHAPAAAPGSSPPAGPPSAAASPRCCRVSLPPVGQEQGQFRSQRPVLTARGGRRGEKANILLNEGKLSSSFRLWLPIANTDCSS